MITLVASFRVGTGSGVLFLFFKTLLLAVSWINFIFAKRASELSAFR